MEDVVNVKFAVLHDGFIHAGKNFDSKLDLNRYSGLTLKYDRVQKELLITYNNETMNMPEPNVKGYVIGDFKPRTDSAAIHHPMIAHIHTAQVETPQSHVHAGLGKGKK